MKLPSVVLKERLARMRFGTILAAACAAIAASGAVVEVTPVEGNATPSVRAAVARLRDGDTLQFVQGEYHFFEEGAEEHFLASVGSSTGMKKVVMHLEGLKDVTIDGGGASFVFHGDSFPFIVERCDGVKIGNFTSRVFRLPLVDFTITEKNDDGFLCQLNEGSVPYEVIDGEIFFDLDEGRTDSREREISVHALRYAHIQYITTPGCTCNKDTLASSFYAAAAEDRGGGKVFFRYFADPHPKNAGKCSYPLNEPLCLLLGCGRARSVMAFVDCRDVEVSDVSVRSGVAMGIVAEMSENFKISRYCVRPDEGQHISLTADSIFLVDMKGKIEIADSEICWGLDDVMNIHGNYTRLEKIEGRRAEVGIQRFNYVGYFPYRVGETVEFSRGKGPTKQILGRAVVAEFPTPSHDATNTVIVFDRDVPAEWVGCDIANMSHIPTIWIHDNYFHDCLNVRLSAFADIVFERNRLRNGQNAIYHDDLTGYWGECGPAHTLVARDNDCEDMRGAVFSFVVPFTGHAILTNNRLKGSGSLYSFGSGVAETVEIRQVPAVTDVTTAFDGETRMMTIGYTLSEDAIVTVDILTNGVSIGAEKFADVAGDVNGVVKAGRGTISWRPKNLWPDQQFSEPIFKAEVHAWALDEPPPYLVVWIMEEKGKVRYYESEQALPGGITNAVYREKRLVMSRIPAKGVTWRMGSPLTETGRQANEVPHYVKFTNDYYMGVFPVTQGQAALILGANTSGQSESYPVGGLSYNQIRGMKGGDPDIDWPNTGTAVAPDSFLGKLRAATSLAFDIPTEAQWEYAARAGSAAAYCNGLDCLTDGDAVDANLDQVGWYKRNSGNSVQPVGQKRKNAWGLYDVCGSIWEWCRDWVGTDSVTAYGDADVIDPPGLSAGTMRSRRGGCFNNVPWAARCAFRTSDTPTEANGFLSFRLYLPVYDSPCLVTERAAIAIAAEK